MTERVTDINLNRFEINTNGYFLRENQIPDDATVGNITVYFRNIQNMLIKHIYDYDYIVGCVAWMTSAGILKALATRKGVGIVVQKEDFLRPDLGSTSQWKCDLRWYYDKILQFPSSVYMARSAGSTLANISEDWHFEAAIRCAGHCNKRRAPAYPRMHHKFLVFCTKKTDKRFPRKHFYLEPKAVWTGSFNFTKNAHFSLENALFIQSDEIACLYHDVFGEIWAISEKLDWEQDWMTPDFYIEQAE